MTVPAAVAAAPVRMILRWFGHGDLMVVFAADDVLLGADQVEQLAGLPRWASGETLLDEQWPVFAGTPCYLLGDAVARCESDDGPRALEFLAWLTPTLAAAVEHVREAGVTVFAVPSFLGSSPVSRAVRLMREETGVQLTSHGLFEVMCRAGWVSRGTDGDWCVTASAAAAGVLTVRRVTIGQHVEGRGRGRGRGYEQVYVTPAGLAQLPGVVAADAVAVDGPRLRPLFTEGTDE